MCGILGWIGVESETTAAEVARACGLLRHRGPDDEGMGRLIVGKQTFEAFKGGGTDPRLNLPDIKTVTKSNELCVWLGHRRLAILDLTPAGHQPMSDAEGSVWIVFNGEIYNYRELKNALGGRFNTNTDTEVLIAAWKKWGVGMLPKLVGMFAFAIIDFRNAQEPRVFLARDPFGIKPLYYARRNGVFMFSSEIKPLLAFGVPRNANPSRVHRYLIDGVTDYGHETMFSAVRQLPAAHYMTFSIDKAERDVQPVGYWDIPTDSVSTSDPAEAAARVRELFLGSVRLHLRSDVPVGSALSGGIDSSSIVGAIHVVEPDAKIEAFGYVPDDPSCSEERWMEIAAQAAGARLHTCSSNPADLARHLDELVLSQEEPFASTSIFAQWNVFRSAKRNGIKVMLDGQGADEMLAGYGGYPARRLQSLVRAGHWNEALRFWISAGRYLGKLDLARRLCGFSVGATWLKTAKTISGRGGAHSAVDEIWFLNNSSPDDYPDRITGEKRLRAELWHSLRASSLPMLLRYEDRNSMAHSIESRVPFLTVQLAEFLFSLPEELLVNNDGLTKAVFRQAMRGITPQPILDRRDKMGFVTPESTWLQNLRPWVEAQLASADDFDFPGLRTQSIKAQWQELVDGKCRFDFRFWRWINLIAWNKAFEMKY